MSRFKSTERPGIDVWGAYGLKVESRTAKSESEMVLEVVKGALDDAQVSPDEIRMVFFSNCLGGSLANQASIRGQSWIPRDYFPGVPVINIENACAGGGTLAFLANSHAISTQQPVLAVGIEKMSSGSRESVTEGIMNCIPLDQRSDLVAEGKPNAFLSMNAEWGRRLLAKGSATLNDFADAVVRLRNLSSQNPLAQFQEVPTKEQVLNSRQIDAPLTRLMCSSFADGAAALVVGPRRSPRSRDIEMTSSTALSGTGALSWHNRLSQLARQAEVSSGMKTLDFDLVEIHDATIAEFFSSSDALGLNPFSGKAVINSSGGLIGRGHPLGATGLYQILEIVTQLRGEAGTRQVQAAHTGLAVNCGGLVSGDIAICTATTLERKDD